MKRITKNKKELTMSEYGTRASILTSDITINFLNKHQLDKIIPYLTENSYNFEFESEFTGSNLEYKLHIYNLSGAYNVTHLFKQLEKLDYKVN